MMMARRIKDPEPWSLSLGATVSVGGVRFRVWAPGVSSISLHLVGDRREIPLEPEGKGYFTARLEGLLPGARYTYRLDGERLRPDPVSRYQPEGVHGPSEVVDPGAFSWQDRDWKGIPPEEMILYEIHTGTFTEAGTFEGIIAGLDYLRNDLGVTAIELMPVGQFPGRRNWGYDGVYLYAPQNSYGGPGGLKRLINACHGLGLAVILDVVYNHLGPEGNYLGEYGPYFTDRYKTPWGKAINFDGPESDPVRKFIVDNALYWITEYHADGLRLDAVQGIFDFSARHILEELRESVHQAGTGMGRRAVVFAESDLNDVRVIDPPRKGGYGLDAQWNEDFHHGLHTLLTGEKIGYYRDFGEVRQLAKAFREGFVYSGQYSGYRRRRHGSRSARLPASRFILFSQNHDQIGNRLKGERLSSLVPFEALKLAAGTVLLAPGIPLLFMGEEYGEQAPFLYFTSHGDPELIEAVRSGRKEEAAAFGWEGPVTDPQAEAAFLRSRIDPGSRRQGTHKILFEFYQRLIRLRKELLSSPFWDKKKMDLQADDGKKIMVLTRPCAEGHLLFWLNFNDRTETAEAFIRPGHWEKICDSASERWGGPGGTAPDVFRSRGSKISFRLPAFAFILHRSRTVGT